MARKHGTGRQIVGLVVGALVVSAAMPAGARESNLLVELPQKIKASIEEVAVAQRQARQSAEAREVRIKQVVEQVDQAEEHEQRVRGQREYLALRAEGLEDQALMVERVEREIAAIAGNLDRLERVRQDSRERGLGEGIRRDDPQARQAISGTFRGIASILKQVENLSPGATARAGQMLATCRNLDQTAREFFAGRAHESLREQKEFVLEVAMLVQSVKLLLRDEHGYLLSQLWYVDSQDIVVRLGEMGTLVDGLDVRGALRDWHATDEEVLRSHAPVAAAPSRRAAPAADFDRWGQW